MGNDLLFRLPLFEEKARQHGFEMTYADETNRKAILAFADDFSLLMRYSQEVLSICKEHNEINPAYTKIINFTQIIKKNEKEIEDEYCYHCASPNPEEKGSLAQKEMISLLLTLTEETGVSCFENMPLAPFFYSEYNTWKNKYIFNTAFQNVMSKWDEEIIFFILLKVDEILNKHDYYLE